MKMSLISKLIPTLFVAAGLFVGCGGGHNHDHDHEHDGDGKPDHAPGEHKDDNDKGAAADDYPLKTCVVSGEELGGDHGEAFVFLHEGRTVKFCCEPCKEDFLEEPAKYLAMIDAAKDGNAPTGEDKSSDKGGEGGESKEEGESK